LRQLFFGEKVKEAALGADESDNIVARSSTIWDFRKGTRIAKAISRPLLA
jgi:hypothetical protein